MRIDLPGYPEELQLMQDLDIINSKIRYIGSRIKAARPILFLFTLLFSLVSVSSFYFFAQNSIFAKEHTWWVFIGYLAVCGILFLLSYSSLRLYYKRQISKLFKECRELIKDFLERYKKRAEEFERNVNAAMGFVCTQDKHFKLSEQRHDTKWEKERFRWHKFKIQSILKNLEYFNAFTAGTAAAEESNPPQIPSKKTPYQHDDAHSEFYQMRIFGSQG